MDYIRYRQKEITRALARREWLIRYVLKPVWYATAIFAILYTLGRLELALGLTSYEYYVPLF